MIFCQVLIFLKISSEQFKSNADKTFVQIAKESIKLHFTLVIFFFFFAEGKRALWCQSIARIFRLMMLQVNDVCIILDRKHDRDYERTIEIYQLCNFPHIQFC